MFWLGVGLGVAAGQFVLFVVMSLLSHPPRWWDCEAPSWLCMDCRLRWIRRVYQVRGE